MLDLYYSNDRTNVTISAFKGTGDYSSSTKIIIENTTLKENRFETQEEALHDFMWLILSNILDEEKYNYGRKNYSLGST